MIGSIEDTIDVRILIETIIIACLNPNIANGIGMFIIFLMYIFINKHPSAATPTAKIELIKEITILSLANITKISLPPEPSPLSTPILCRLLTILVAI